MKTKIQSLLKNIISIMTDYKILSLADKISFFALLVALFSILATIWQIRITQHQFNISRQDGLNTMREENNKYLEQQKKMQEKDSIETAFMKSQIDLLKAELEYNARYFEYQRTRDSLHLSVTVRPLLTVKANAMGTEEFSGIYFYNSGLGPATVTKVEIKFGADKLNTFEQLMLIFNREYRDISVSKYYYWFQFYSKKGYTLVPNSKLWVFYSKNDEIADHEKFADIIEKKLTLHIEYKSITNELHSIDFPGRTEYRP